MKKKSTHGGYREGSGRKKKEPTKVIRVPVNKPDFAEIALDHMSIVDHDRFSGFVKGCEYVWNKFIFSKL